MEFVDSLLEVLEDFVFLLLQLLIEFGTLMLYQHRLLPARLEGYDFVFHLDHRRVFGQR